MPHQDNSEKFYPNLWINLEWSNIILIYLSVPTLINYMPIHFTLTSITGRFLLDNLDCTGEEENLAQCRHEPWGSDNCGQSEHVVVNCSSESKWTSPIMICSINCECNYHYNEYMHMLPHTKNLFHIFLNVTMHSYIDTLKYCY